MICQRCNAENKESALFCASCGANLKTGEGYLTRQFNQKDLEDIKKASNGYEAKAKITGNKDKQKNFKLLFILIGIIALSGLIYLGYSFLKDSDIFKSKQGLNKNNNFVFRRNDRKYAVVSKNGKILSDFYYSINPAENDLFVVKKEEYGGYEVIDKKGNIKLATDGKAKKPYIGKTGNYFIKYNDRDKPGLIYNSDFKRLGDYEVIENIYSDLRYHDDLGDYSLLVLYSKKLKTLKFMASDGKLYKEFKNIDSPEKVEIISEYSYFNKDQSTLIVINDKGYFINFRKKGFIYEVDFEELKAISDDIDRYSFEISENKNSVLVKVLSSDSKEGVGYKQSYKYYAEGKLIKTETDYFKSLYLYRGSLRVRKGNDKFYYRYDGKKVDSLDSTVTLPEERYYFNEYDTDTYISETKGKYLLHKNGKTKKIDECYKVAEYSPIIKNNYIEVENDEFNDKCRQNKLKNSFIDSEGNIIKPPKNITGIYNITNSFYRVKDGNSQSYIADKDFKKILEDYNEPTFYGDFIIASRKLARKSYIFNSKLEKIAEIPEGFDYRLGEAGDPYIVYYEGSKKQEDSYFFWPKDPSKFEQGTHLVFFNLKTEKKHRLNIKKYLSIETIDGYLKLETKDKYIYQTYGGNKFYEE